MRLLLALTFAAGVGVIWLSVACGIEIPKLNRRTTHGAVRYGAIAPGCALVGAVIAWPLGHLPALTAAAAFAGGYAPFALRRRRRASEQRAREQAWPAALAQLADALEAGIAFPAAVALVAGGGPSALRADLASFHTRLRSQGLAAALDGLAAADERTADTVALLLRAALLELPSGGAAPVLRDLSDVLRERGEAREKARSRASSLQLEATILAISPVALLLLVGAASPGYLAAYRTVAGSVVSLFAAVLIFGCYLLMRRLGRIPEPRRTGVAK
jgi:tight adherence protein B